MDVQTVNSIKVKSRSLGDLTHHVTLLSLDEDLQHLSTTDVPLLSCNQTKTYLSRSKIMVMMKGLPGSGKSTIVKALSKTYCDAVVCSADKYFERRKKYEYDSKLLTAAHTFCQQTAIDAVEAHKPLIIIDNTNLQHWEMKFYIDLAHKFNYVVIAIEPKTHWSKDVTILAKKNSHGLDVTILKKKIKCYEALSPLFFGWFLNEADSYAIVQMACDWLEKAFRLDQFKDFVQKCFGSNSLAELTDYFSKCSYSLSSLRLLHCTSKYSAKEDQKFIEEYMKSEAVLKQLGTVSTLAIVAFIITPNTYGARVMLTKDQLEVWCNDVCTISSAGKKKKRFYPPQRASNTAKVPIYSPDVEALKKNSKIQQDMHDIEQLISFPITEKGCKAHLTLGTAEGTPPAQTGLELHELLTGDTINTARYDVPGAIVMDHGNNRWGIYPNCTILVKALFSYQL